MPAHFAACPRCGGYPELDESGRPYACHFCCDTGRVPATVADAFYRAEQDEAEQFRPARLGIHLRRPASEWDWDEFDEPAPGHRLFTRLVRPVRQPIPADALDDIPF